jgi:VIT1/CCC1 family predicted Fe2+/Mn2+ transporter
MALYHISDEDYEGLLSLKQQLEQQLAQAHSKYMAALFNRLHKVISQEYVKATRAREIMARTQANQLLEKLRSERQQQARSSRSQHSQQEG